MYSSGIYFVAFFFSWKLTSSRHISPLNLKTYRTFYDVYLFFLSNQHTLLHFQHFGKFDENLTRALLNFFSPELQ